MSIREDLVQNHQVSHRGTQIGEGCFMVSSVRGGREYTSDYSQSASSPDWRVASNAKPVTVTRKKLWS